MDLEKYFSYNIKIQSIQLFFNYKKKLYKLMNREQNNAINVINIILIIKLNFSQQLN